MFNLLFQQIRNVHFHTQVLEICEWDEKRADELISELYTVLDKMSTGGFDHNLSLKENLIESLTRTMDENEVDILIGIIEEVLNSSASLRIEDEDYEN